MMNMENEQLKNIGQLFSRYVNGLCTREEYDRLLELMGDAAHEEELKSLLDQLWLEMEGLERPSIQPAARPLYRRLLPYAAAAGLLIAATVGILQFRRVAPVTGNDVAPFTAKAILKTGKGKRILLDSTASGQLAKQNGVTISKTGSGQITYAGANTVAVTVYDTIQVPAGGRPYELSLSEGSKITLNAATTLRYPESFSVNRQEQLELISGEIYAEVLHQENAPLQIKAAGQLITDLGTVFDISAYPDEADSRTTLIEGAVKVSAGTLFKNLLPGQQSIYDGKALQTAPADIAQVGAWKKGDFVFKGEKIDVIMRQLARWYDIEVKYEGKISDEVFYGQITRKKKISEVLRMLEKTQKVHFKVEGRRVTVSSK